MSFNCTRKHCPAEAAQRPILSLQSENATLANETFVLLMVDPDAPTPQDPTLSPIRHLLAGGLTVNGSLTEGAMLINSTATLSDYIPPTPPPDSDPHRYVTFDVHVTQSNA